MSNTVTKTPSKASLFRMHVEINDELLKRLKKTPELVAEAVMVGAKYWRENFLPGHFIRGAKDKYGYGDRSSKYMKSSQKKGKPYLVLSGSLSRDIKATAAYKIGASFITMTMSARVLNFIPNMLQKSDQKQVRQSNGRMYPNIKREIKVVIPEEAEAIAKVVTKAMEKLYKEAQD